ncbi:hypothetical protein [Candidatus Bacteroides intestinigallinarum]|jgi:hypothetical protein|uniref:hypothetical protein n=1 Tax=Candidatus Bacteroides intestinigallinarum TaxID=2838470 RepID=UPI0020671551|nr:hypothetical protein [Candidatus Bacteroides intestinigallinarum]MCS3200211.1 hypothetical protein [Candidatus Bacteroides intestinigallinarum]DAS85429.1 MAG TPA: hypothetical protein [Caudoviricetes sp.]
MKNIISRSIKSFDKHQRQMKDVLGGNETKMLQDAIDSKRELNKQDRMEELESLNKNLIKQLKYENRNSNIRAIICGALGCIIGGIFMYYFPDILKWICRS